MFFVVEMSPFPLIEQVHLMLMFANSAYKILVQLEIVPFPSKSKASLDRKGKNGFTAVFNASLSHRSDTYLLTNIQSQQFSPLITQILFFPHPWDTHLVPNHSIKFSCPVAFLPIAFLLPDACLWLTELLIHYNHIFIISPTEPPMPAHKHR